MANKVTTLIDVSTNDELYPRTKASAVSDNDGNSLGNVAVCNYATLNSGISTIHLGIEMDLLWTNPDPSTAFSAQTVSLNLSDYNLVVIKCRYTNESATMTDSMCVVGTDSMVYAFPPQTSTGTTNRRATVSTSGIEFSNGFKDDATGVDTSRCIPYEIYGIR